MKGGLILKIVIIGITGRMGKRIVKELIDRGHEVTGINRRPEQVSVQVKDVRIKTLVGDTANYESILSGIQGADVVVLATAPTREHPEAYVKNNQNVIRAVKAAGIKRLIALSNYMALKGPDGRRMLEAEPPHPWFYNIEAVFEKEVEIFRNETQLDWLLVSPPAELFPYGEVTGKYRIGKTTLLVNDITNPATKETSRLSMEDLAYFIAEEINQHKYSREQITLAYA
jgi:uncharacterized protein